ncbi:type IV secretion system protein [Pelistega sp. MC2]|uniref:type IV secretion system protein n=1 Tax=Pelistega sp. MC2 TaxID=1720297 RepID=UPI000B0D3C1C|nr:type IV secretion system protein [Pelistega sp. MC2]
MMKFKNIVLVISSIFAITTAKAGGIPVIDGAALAQDAANFVKQIAEMKNQVENQIKQLTELKNQVSAMTGGRGMGNIARNVIDNVPDSWKEIYSKTQDIANNTRLNDKFDPEAGTKGLLSMLDSTDQTFSDIKQRISRIEELTNKINTTTDIKASADLQNRIAAEQTAISNQQVKLDQMQRAYELQKELQHKKYIKNVVCHDRKAAGLPLKDCN